MAILSDRSSDNPRVNRGGEFYFAPAQSRPSRTDDAVFDRKVDELRATHRQAIGKSRAAAKSMSRPHPARGGTLPWRLQADVRNLAGGRITWA